MGSLFRGARSREDTLLLESPNWDDLKYCFVKDGALRDIRIDDIEADDFPRFFEFIKERMERIDYLVEGRTQELPGSFKEYHHNAVEHGATLSLTFDKFQFNCHSFCSEYLELDFWPDSVTKENFPKFLELLTELGRAVSRDLTVSDEGSSSPIFLRYSHAKDSLVQVPENLVKKKSCLPEELSELLKRDC
jgi:hypothetical protein